MDRAAVLDQRDAHPPAVRQLDVPRRDLAPPAACGRRARDLRGAGRRAPGSKSTCSWTSCANPRAGPARDRRRPDRSSARCGAGDVRDHADLAPGTTASATTSPARAGSAAANRCARGGDLRLRADDLEDPPVAPAQHLQDELAARAAHGPRADRPVARDDERASRQLGLQQRARGRAPVGARRDSRGPRRHRASALPSATCPAGTGAMASSRRVMATATSAAAITRQSQEQRTPAAGQTPWAREPRAGAARARRSGERRVERRDEARRVGEPLARVLREAAREHGVDRGGSAGRRRSPAAPARRRGRTGSRRRCGAGTPRRRPAARTPSRPARSGRSRVWRDRRARVPAPGRAASRGPRRSAFPPPHLAVTGEPEVGEQHATIAHEDVGRLDVAVHDARGVRVVERPRHRAQDRERISGRAATSSIATHGPYVGSLPYPRTAAIAGWSSPACAWRHAGSARCPPGRRPSRPRRRPRRRLEHDGRRAPPQHSLHAVSADDRPRSDGDAHRRSHRPSLTAPSAAALGFHARGRWCHGIPQHLGDRLLLARRPGVRFKARLRAPSDR